MPIMDRSVRAMLAAPDPTGSLDVLLGGLERARCHLVALEVWCDAGAVASAAEALRAQRSARPWVPPLRAGEGPGSRAAAFEGGGALYERVRGLVASDELGLVLVVDPTPSPAREACWLAASLLGRPQDALAEAGAQLELLTFPRLRVLSPRVERAVAATTWAELCRRTAVPPAAELRAVLTRHARGWTYVVRHADRDVATASLTDVLGAALAALVRAPGSDAFRQHEVARGLGWRAASDPHPELVEGRVRAWHSRIRRELATWAARGLGAFVPEARARRLAGSVDIRFDPDLPFAPPWPDPPTSSPSSTTGPS